MRTKLIKMIYLIIGWLMLNSLLSSSTYAQIRTRVVLESGGNQITRANLGKALTAIMQEANRLHQGRGNLENVRPYCTENGLRAFKELVEKTGMFSTFREYRMPLLETAAGQYEVRGLQVRVNLGETAGDPIQELVFLIDSRLYVDNVHFALEVHHYQRLLAEGLKLEDMMYRKQILDFLEEYRTAHNWKDIDYLEKVYSDYALIIVGGPILEPKGKELEGTLEQSKLKLVRKSKQEYIAALHRVFKLNSFVKVFFDDVAITRHPKYPEIYGIKVRQRWTSSRFNDKGYLFVMIDFLVREKPIIHVRAWQAEPFSDGSVIDLGDFPILNRN